MITIDRLDHLVLTVRSISTCCEFYANVLGMQIQTFGDGRTALLFGNQKFNLHETGNEIEPKATSPTPGSADICLITNDNIVDAEKHLTSCHVAIELGPVTRTGATGSIESLYFRDPDGNLIELSAYL
ncbi:MAG: VOC family protein [Granulosicoccus sp.]